MAEVLVSGIAVCLSLLAVCQKHSLILWAFWAGLLWYVWLQL